MWVAGFAFSLRRELDLVLLSFKQGDELASLGGEDFVEGAGPLAALCAGLEKKPKMLFCLPPVDDMELVFLDSDGVLGSAFSPISKVVSRGNK